MRYFQNEAAWILGMLRIIIRRKINIHSRTPFILLWNWLAMSKFQFYFQRKFLNDRVFNLRKLVQEFYILCKTSCWWILRQTAKNKRLFKSLIWIYGHTSEFNSQTQKSERGEREVLLNLWIEFSIEWFSAPWKTAHLQSKFTKTIFYSVITWQETNEVSLDGFHLMITWKNFTHGLQRFRTTLYGELQNSFCLDRLEYLWPSSWDFQR